MKFKRPGTQLDVCYVMTFLEVFISSRKDSALHILGKSGSGRIQYEITQSYVAGHKSKRTTSHIPLTAGLAAGYSHLGVILVAVVSPKFCGEVTWTC